MARRRLAIKRLDPWSVLKFGVFFNLVLFVVFLLVAGVIWFIVDRLQLVDQACEIALDVGFTTCGVNPGNLFQVLALLGGMWVVVQTAVLVFMAFLYNLIADLTGGLVIGAVDDGPAGDTGVREPGSAGAAAAPGGWGSGDVDPAGPSTRGSGRQPSAQPRAQTPGQTSSQASGHTSGKPRDSAEPLFDRDQ